MYIGSRDLSAQPEGQLVLSFPSQVRKIERMGLYMSSWTTYGVVSSPKCDVFGNSVRTGRHRHLNWKVNRSQEGRSSAAEEVDAVKWSVAVAINRCRHINFDALR